MKEQVQLLFSLLHGNNWQKPIYMHRGVNMHSPYMHRGVLSDAKDSKLMDVRNGLFLKSLLVSISATYLITSTSTF